jgi:hypothetical protein
MAPNVLGIYNRMAKLPFGMGQRLFSLLFCMQAPYFFTIRPRIRDLRPGFASVNMPLVRCLHFNLACDSEVNFGLLLYCIRFIVVAKKDPER